LFKREDGFFVGAILTNMVITELVVLVAYLTFLPVINSHYQLILTFLLAVALLFPVVFYHHSWSVWLSFDHLIETLPKADGKRPSKV
jgi:putative flippase GtrA